jgi:hypothetical protein
MAKTTDKTIWTLALVAIAGFAAWKLLPVLLKRLNGGGSSGGSSGGVGSSSPYPYEPDYGEGSNQNPLANLSLGGGSGSGSGGMGGGGSIASAFSNWLSGVLGYGQNAANGMSTDLGYNPSTGTDLLGSLDNLGLPLET